MKVIEQPSTALAALSPSAVATAERDFAAGLMFRYFAEGDMGGYRPSRYTPDIIAAALKREPEYLAKLEMEPANKAMIARYDTTAERPTKVRTIIRGASATEEFSGINHRYHQTNTPGQSANMQAMMVLAFFGREALAKLGKELIESSAPKLKAAGRMEEAFLDSYQTGVLRDSPTIRALVLQHGQPDMNIKLGAGQQTTLSLAMARGDEDIMQYARDKTAKRTPSALIPK